MPPRKRDKLFNLIRRDRSKSRSRPVSAGGSSCSEVLTLGVDPIRGPSLTSTTGHLPPVGHQQIRTSNPVPDTTVNTVLVPSIQIFDSQPHTPASNTPETSAGQSQGQNILRGEAGNLAPLSETNSPPDDENVLFPSGSPGTSGQSQSTTNHMGGGSTTKRINPPCLWDRTVGIANEKLTKNNLPPIDATNPNSKSAVENIQSVIGELEASHTHNKEKPWVERLSKILKTVEKYSKTIDTAIQHNPEVIALVWAGARTILQIAINHFDAIECLETTILMIGEKVAICEFYAGIYEGLASISTTKPELHHILNSALPAMYAAIIVFSFKARQYFDARWLRNIAHTLKPFTHEIQPFVDEIAQKEKIIRECADSATMERIREMETLLRDIRIEMRPLTQINDLHKITEDLRTILEDDKICNLLGLLSPLEPLKRHRDISSARLPNTGTWLLQTKHFRTWSDPDIHGNTPGFCCFGMPGAGKTVICSLVIDTLISWFQGHSSIRIICLYSDYRDQSNQTLEHILGSFLHQLLSIQPTIPDEELKKLEDIKRRRDKMGLAKLQDWLKKMVQPLKALFVCIDALDELEPKTRFQLLRVLKELNPNITRLFFTGRQHIESEVQACFGIQRVQKVNIHATQHDIEAYLRKEIEDDRIPEAIDIELSRDIVAAITARSHGMFLLPTLHIKMVLEMTTKSQRRSALQTLPIDLDDTFTKAVTRIQEAKEQSQSDLGMRVLMWLHLAYRPLRIEELQHALSVKPEQSGLDADNIPSVSTILAFCSGLVIVDAETKTIRFVHYTVEEYFRKYSNKYFPDGCSSVAEVCLTYLNFRQLVFACESLDEIKARMPLVGYAAVNWGHYVRRQCNEALIILALKLLNPSRGSLYARLFVEEFPFMSFRSGYKREPLSGLHIAAIFGVYEIVKVLCESYENNIKKQDGCGYTPLAWEAHESGHEEIVRLLLERSDVNVDSKDIPDRTPLSWAAEYGHEAVVRLLLERTNNVNAVSKDDNGRTPLSWAARSGHEAIVRLLLERTDIDVNFKSCNGQAPLSLAAEYVHEAVVRLLLERADVDVNSKDMYGRTPLSYTARSGHEATVRLLLERTDVDVNSESWNGQTPLSSAALFGHEAVVRLLLERADVDVDSKDMRGRTPLSWAAQSGHKEVVRLLLERADVDVDSKSRNDQTPLSSAALFGHEAVVRLLLERADVDADSKEMSGRTPLSWAAQSGHEAVVRLLLERTDVDVNSRDDNGRTPLAWAVEHGHEAVVRLLLERTDVDVDSKDDNGRTPLSCAARFGHETTVRLLIERTHVDVNSKDDNGRTPLSLAATWGHEAVVRQLLLGRTDVDVNFKNKNGRTPLSLAAEYGHEAVVRLLLQRTDVDVNLKNKYGRTPLSFAAEYGDEAVVRLLLERTNVDVDSKDETGRTPLLWAARCNYDRVVRLLESKIRVSDEPQVLI